MNWVPIVRAVGRNGEFHLCLSGVYYLASKTRHKGKREKWAEDFNWEFVWQLASP